MANHSNTTVTLCKLQYWTACSGNLKVWLINKFIRRMYKCKNWTYYYLQRAKLWPIPTVFIRQLAIWTGHERDGNHVWYKIGWLERDTQIYWSSYELWVLTKIVRDDSQAQFFFKLIVRSIYLCIMRKNPSNFIIIMFWESDLNPPWGWDQTAIISSWLVVPTTVRYV